MPFLHPRPLAIAMVVLGTTISHGAEIVVQPGKQVAREFMSQRDKDGDKDGKVKPAKVPYLLFVPSSYDETPDQKWPLLLFLHGLGESGDGNLELVKKHGPPKLVEQRPDFPFILVSPQCPPPKNDVAGAWQEHDLMQLVDHVQNSLRVDADRIYVTGLSMGGFGTWRLAATYPDRFAAAAPVCGGGKPDSAKSLSKLPIWCFHGAKDQVVPLALSQQMVDAVKTAGGNVQFTIYPEAGHDSWTATYDNPKLYSWLLSHRRGKP